MHMHTFLSISYQHVHIITYRYEQARWYLGDSYKCAQLFLLINIYIYINYIIVFHFHLIIMYFHIEIICRKTSQI